jgi:predicted nucleic-acid-binding protein
LKAVDTNVVVRLLAEDDPVQAQQARTIFATTQVWIPKTVVLELEWVLRYTYEFSPTRVAAALRLLLGLRSVIFEDREAVASAVAALGHGFDFADALHLYSSQRAEAFVTFDRKLAKAAAFTPGGLRVEVPAP